MKSSSPVPSVEDLVALKQEGQLAQALLISADPLSQPTIQERLARGILCEQSADPACQCRSCRTPLDAHPDFVELTPSPRTISKEAVRDAVLGVFAGPLWGAAKVIAVRPAEHLGREAESYFLKHLEEPPPYVFYLLLTEAPDAIIATIKSRCQVWRLNTAATPAAQSQDIYQEIGEEPLTATQVVKAAYFSRQQYRKTGSVEWLKLWDTLEGVFRQLEANGNEDLARAMVLRAWPTGERR